MFAKTRPFAKILPLSILVISIVALSAANLMAATEDLPPAEKVLEKYFEVIGGLEAIQKVKSRITVSTMSIPAKKAEIKTTLYQQRPDKSYSLSEMVALGKTWVTEAGKNGDVVWIKYPMRKERLLTGMEKEQRMKDWAFDPAIVSWKDNFKEAKVLGVKDVEGKPCYEVLLTSKDGSEEDMVCFFDKEKYLMTKVIRDYVVDDKKEKIELIFSDYKPVENLLVAHTIKTTDKDGNDVITTINSVKANIDIPAEKFELPENVKEDANEKS